MENLIFIALEAHNAERNHHRRYEVAVGRDLFGEWTVTVRYGRVGRSGCREERFGGRDEDQLRHALRVRLARRISARRRIGCAYRLAAMERTPGLSGDWLPVNLLAQLCA